MSKFSVIEYLKEKNVEIVPMLFEEVKASVLFMENKYFIFIDPSKFESYEEFIDAIWHEYYHIVTGTLHKYGETDAVNICEDMTDILVEYKWKM